MTRRLGVARLWHTASMKPVCLTWKYYMRAKAWSDYGSLLRRDRVAPGAILVFDRAGGGHVGFYVGEDTGHYYVLGGNQGNAVNIMKLGKSSSCRMPLA